LQADDDGDMAKLIEKDEEGRITWHADKVEDTW
jgi:hypothetical protein